MRQVLWRVSVVGLTVLTLHVCAVLSAGWAADKMSHEGNRESALSREQKLKVDAMLEDEQKQLHAVQSDSSLTQLQKVLEEIDIRRSFRLRRKAILTSDQQANSKADKSSASHEKGHRELPAP